MATTPKNWAQTMLEQGFVVIDTETTGLDPVDDILQVVIIDHEGNVLYNSYIKPETAIDETRGAFAVNGITNEMVKDAPSFKEAFAAFSVFLLNNPVVAYNAEYDWSMVHGNCWKHGIPLSTDQWKAFACAKEAFAEYADLERWVGLSRACGMMGVKHENRHDGLGDCLATLELIKAMAAA